MLHMNVATTTTTFVLVRYFWHKAREVFTVLLETVPITIFHGHTEVYFLTKNVAQGFTRSSSLKRFHRI